MFLLVELFKLWLCLDGRYLNLWIKDFLFCFEILNDVYRLIDLEVWMVICDEKLGYEYIVLFENL